MEDRGDCVYLRDENGEASIIPKSSKEFDEVIPNLPPLFSGKVNNSPEASEPTASAENPEPAPETPVGDDSVGTGEPAEPTPAETELLPTDSPAGEDTPVEPTPTQ